ncbi:MAG TPA: histidine kinase [Candidatus Limnocylindrales bacterium]|nr:histidine kinase [Candidatus Limnocylindrales bacterium]
MSSTQRDRTPDVEAAGSLAVRLSTDIAALDAELAEIELLVTQAGAEAGRHEQRRSQTADKLATATNLPAADLAALNAQLVSLTRRASVMEAQVEVLEGKRKTLSRFRDTLLELAEAYGGVQATGAGAAGGPARVGAGDGSGMSRIVLNAQEDLRREIARSMHDGPAQSLTNIVLQAQIVERLLGRDPEGARGELRLLTSMVQQTLDATKTFIFDVRPMVLDDLGLVPTLRRAARERGRRAGIPVEFDSMGQDRRIDVDLESTLFRIVDEALTGFLAARPDRVAIRLDWTDDLVEAEVTAERDPTTQMAQADQAVADAARASDDAGKDLPPALESMLEDRRERAAAQQAAARAAAIVSLPPATWREIQQRAATTGVVAELDDAGGRLVLRAETTAGAGGDDGGGEPT